MRTAVFTMGLPGAGKSTVVEARFDQIPGSDTNAYIIDPDEIKKTLPGYDPKNTAVVHEASVAIAEGRFYEALSRGELVVVMQGTGTNLDGLFTRMNAARTAGYQTHILYVRVPLAVALKRNARRERSVPDAVIQEKAGQIERAYAAAAAYADTAEVVDN